MNIQEKELVVSYLTLRQMIGWAGLLMPIAVRLGSLYFQHIFSTESISAYYYTGMRDVCVATLVLGGALLACYRSPARQDSVVATIAGIAAIGIALFPMKPEFAQEILDAYAKTGTPECYIIRGILGYHFLFVGTFFLLTFYLVSFRFSAFTPNPPTSQKLARNRIYRICGVAMLVAFVWIAILWLRHNGESIFWPETLAVVSFSAAWLVKGQTVLKDPRGVATAR
jgi:hypothetical protein